MSKRKQIKQRMWLSMFVAIVLFATCAPLSVGVGAKIVYLTAPINDPLIGTSGKRLQSMLNSAAERNSIFRKIVEHSPTPTKVPLLSLGNVLSAVIFLGLIASGFFIRLFFAYWDRLGKAKRKSDDEELVEDFSGDRIRIKKSMHGEGKAYDVFISHASEDKEDFVRPLASLLCSKGLDVWYDETTLKIGDSLRRSIDRGLSKSSYGVVVLSKSFLSKDWPQYELDGLVSKEMDLGKAILPLWHKITKEEVLSYSPSIADRVAINTALLTTEEIATKIVEVVRGGKT